MAGICCQQALRLSQVACNVRPCLCVCWCGGFRSTGCYLLAQFALKVYHRPDLNFVSFLVREGGIPTAAQKPISIPAVYIFPSTCLKYGQKARAAMPNLHHTVGETSLSKTCQIADSVGLGFSAQLGGDLRIQKSPGSRTLSLCFSTTQLRPQMSTCTVHQSLQTATIKNIQEEGVIRKAVLSKTILQRGQRPIARKATERSSIQSKHRVENGVAQNIIGARWKVQVGTERLNPASSLQTAN